MSAVTNHYISNAILALAVYFLWRSGAGNHVEYIPLAILLTLWSSFRRMRFWKPSIPDGLSLLVLGYWIMHVYMPSLGEDALTRSRILILVCASYVMAGALTLLVLSHWEKVEDSPD